MNLKLTLPVLFIVILVTSGCSSVAHLKTNDDSVHAAKTDPKTIKVYSTKEIGRPCRILGLVVANADASENAAKSVDHLKEEAAELGANAIVDMRLEASYGMWESGIKSTGITVRY